MSTANLTARGYEVGFLFSPEFLLDVLHRADVLEEPPRKAWIHYARFKSEGRLVLGFRGENARGHAAVLDPP